MDVTTGPTTRPSRPGPIHDWSMRSLVEADPAAFCDWVDVPLTGPPQLLAARFTDVTTEADLLVRVGPNRLLHAEYEREGTKGLARRMLGYRAQIMDRHPGLSLSQCAVVLGEGRVTSIDDSQTGFRLGLRTIYLRDCDPADLLARPSLAALAVLGRGDDASRVEALAETLRIAREQPPDQERLLIQAAVKLATIYLDPSTIAEVRNNMDLTTEGVAEYLRHTDFGEELHRQGQAEGLEQGLEQGLERSLAAQLRVRFGNDARIPAIATRLAKQSEDDAFRAIGDAASLDDLLD